MFEAGLRGSLRSVQKSFRMCLVQSDNPGTNIGSLLADGLLAGIG